MDNYSTNKPVPEGGNLLSTKPGASVGAPSLGAGAWGRPGDGSCQAQARSKLDMQQGA